MINFPLKNGGYFGELHGAWLVHFLFSFSKKIENRRENKFDLIFLFSNSENGFSIFGNSSNINFMFYSQSFFFFFVVILLFTTPHTLFTYPLCHCRIPPLLPRDEIASVNIATSDDPDRKLHSKSNKSLPPSHSFFRCTHSFSSATAHYDYTTHQISHRSHSRWMPPPPMALLAFVQTIFRWNEEWVVWWLHGFTGVVAEEHAKLG